MSLIRRSWTPHDADEWCKEDWYAIIISPLAYISLCLGVALSFLLLPIGFVVLFIGLLLTFFMFFIIDPKLKTISNEYEKKQKTYLKQLERITRWEEPHE